MNEKEKASEWHRPYIANATAKRFSSTSEYSDLYISVNKITVAQLLSFRPTTCQFGFHSRFVNIPDQYSTNIGLVVRKNEVERRADIWRRLLRAVRRGINAWYENPQLAKSVIAKYTRDNDPVTLEKTYEFFTKQAASIRI